MARRHSEIRVLHLVLSLDVGGLEKLVYEMVRRGPAHGVRASVACMDHGGGLAEALAGENMEIVELRRRGAINLRLIWRLAQYCRRAGVRIVHSHSGCMLYAAMLHWMCPRLRIVHTDHGRHYPEIDLVCTEERVAARWINHIVSVSHVLADYLVKRVRLPRGRIQVIWNGVDLARFRPPRPGERYQVRKELGIARDATVIGTTGRLAPVKNQGLLLAGFARLPQNARPAHLLIVGDGPLRRLLAVEAGRLGINGMITFAGQRDDVHRMLWAMDLFALSSNSEGMPVTILEALASGLPCVATAVGDLPLIARMCPRVITVPLRQEEPFSRALVQQLAAAGSTAGKTFCRSDFAIDRMIAKYVRLYHRVLGLECEETRAKRV